MHDAGKAQAEPSRWQKFEVLHYGHVFGQGARGGGHDMRFQFDMGRGDAGTWAATRLPYWSP